jgi:hypothetical protein
MIERFALLARLAFCATVVLGMLVSDVAAEKAEPSDHVFARYTDPARRFTLDYPATMKVDASNPNEVRFYHPRASLRINIFLEKRTAKSVPDAKALLGVFVKSMKRGMKDFSVMEEGKLAGLGGSQGFLICTFKDRREIQLVQLVQYYVAKAGLLQLIITDRPEGFRNLLQVIRKIHRSLRVQGALLK